MNDIDTATIKSSASPRRSRISDVTTGLIVILVGLVFLADNFGIAFPFSGWRNGWALFIMIGAASPVGHAIDRYRSAGAIDAQVVRSMISALAVVAIALMFLLDLSLALWWPVFVIIGGLCMLFPDGMDRSRK